MKEEEYRQIEVSREIIANQNNELAELRKENERLKDVLTLLLENIDQHGGICEVEVWEEAEQALNKEQ